MITVDANVVAYAFIEGESTEQARRLWLTDPMWCLPTFWRHEYLNILATFGKYGGAEREQLLALWNRAVGLLRDHEHEVDMTAALELAVERGISAYDAQYVVLATELDVPLVTEDKKLRAAVPERTLSMTSFLKSHAR